MALLTLSNVLHNQLEVLYSCEMQQLRVMPRVAESVSSEEVKEAVEHHIAEVEVQLARLERISQLLGFSLSDGVSTAMHGLTSEAMEAACNLENGDTRDLAVLAALRRIEQYEMGAYSGAKELSEAINRHEITKLLDETLQEEEQIEQMLTVLSEDLIDELSFRAEMAPESGREINPSDDRPLM